MRTLILTVCLGFCALTQGFGQFSVGLKAGTAPDVNPGTHHMIVNRADPSHLMLFNVQQVSHGEQIGLVFRYDIQQWWFSTELMYAKTSTKYSMEHVHAAADATQEFAAERRSVLDIPISAGVKLGVAEIFSGFTMTHNLSTTSQMDGVAGYTAALPDWSAGWHSGIGINVQKLTLDVRYQQTFSNYGQDRYINGEELMLHNSPGRIVVLVGFRI